MALLRSNHYGIEGGSRFSLHQEIGSKRIEGETCEIVTVDVDSKAFYSRRVTKILVASCLTLPPSRSHLVILLTVCHTILMRLVWRSW